MSEVEKLLMRYGVIPVAVIERSGDAVPLAGALVEGGLPCVEVTFRTKAAADSIAAISAAVPDVLVGAGTVLSVDQARSAVDAGARFVVAPGCDVELVDWCLDAGVDVFPGCATASEITQAYKRGIRTVKFFPCGQLGGLAAIDALAAPFSNLRFIPTGGINLSNVSGYLASDRVLACGGSWVAPKALISSGDYGEISLRAASVRELARSARG
jgi:2-dehydro-3-deoxyphosphogluconate aldolase/(4S)-4-hydroxy-2-oxoglutarate aldolase